LTISGIGKLNNDPATLFTAKALHSEKHRPRKANAFMLELCFLTRLLFLSEPLGLFASGEMEVDQNQRSGIGSSSAEFSSSHSLNFLLPSSPLAFLAFGFFPLHRPGKAWKISEKWHPNANVVLVATTSSPITGIAPGRHFGGDPSVGVPAAPRPNASAAARPKGTFPLQDD